eukprot:351786-Chlamydomonas_euryale.AAC.2
MEDYLSAGPRQLPGPHRMSHEFTHCTSLFHETWEAPTTNLSLASLSVSTRLMSSHIICQVHVQPMVEESGVRFNKCPGAISSLAAKPWGKALGHSLAWQPTRYQPKTSTPPIPGHIHAHTPKPRRAEEASSSM